MEYKTLMEPVLKIYFKVAIPGDMDVAQRNREIRNWLSRHCDYGWETIMQLKYIEVYFDIKAEKDAATFRMFWDGTDK